MGTARERALERPTETDALPEVEVYLNRSTLTEHARALPQGHHRDPPPLSHLRTCLTEGAIRIPVLDVGLSDTPASGVAQRQLPSPSTTAPA